MACGREKDVPTVNARTARLSRAADDLFYSSAGVSLVCSLLTVILILRLRKRTGYLGIVAALTASQTLYDSSFLMVELYSYPNGKFVQRFVSYFGGLSSTLWTNVLSYLLLIIIRYGRQYNVKKNFFVLCLAVFVPSTTVAIAALVTEVDADKCVYDDLFWVSFSIRIFSIMFNIFCYCLISCKLQKTHSSSSSCSYNSTMSAAIRVLASRLKWYALIQVVTRSSEIGYEVAFGRNGYNVPDDSWSSSRWFAFLCEATLSPAAGVGYLVTFLFMQPTAWETLHDLIFCISSRSGEEDNYSSSAAFATPGRDKRVVASKTSTPILVRVGGAEVEYDSRSTSDSFSPHNFQPSAESVSSDSSRPVGGIFTNDLPSVTSQSISTNASSRLLEEDNIMNALRSLDDDQLIATIVTGGGHDEIPGATTSTSHNML